MSNQTVAQKVKNWESRIAHVESSERSQLPVQRGPTLWWKQEDAENQTTKLSSSFSRLNLSTTNENFRYSKDPPNIVQKLGKLQADIQTPHERYEWKRRPKSERPGGCLTFLDLPWDIRREVLSYCVANLYPRLLCSDLEYIGPHSSYCKKFSLCENLPPHTWKYADDDPGPEPGVSRVCKQIRQEFLEVLVSNRPHFCEHPGSYSTRFLPKWYKESVEIIAMGYLRAGLDQGSRATTQKYYSSVRRYVCSTSQEHRIGSSPAWLSLFPNLRELRLRWVDTQLTPKHGTICQWREGANHQWIEGQAHTILSRKLEQFRKKRLPPGKVYQLVAERLYFVRCKDRVYDRHGWRIRYPTFFAQTVEGWPGNYHTTITYSELFQELDGKGEDYVWWRPVTTTVQTWP